MSMENARTFEGEFRYMFQITRMVLFEVSYYTLGDNARPYFATSAHKFNQPKTDYTTGGQVAKISFYKAVELSKQPLRKKTKKNHGDSQ